MHANFLGKMNINICVAGTGEEYHRETPEFV